MVLAKFHLNATMSAFPALAFFNCVPLSQGMAAERLGVQDPSLSPIRSAYAGMFVGPAFVSRRSTLPVISPPGAG